MARPKLDKPKRIKLTLTVDPTVRTMAKCVSEYKNVSISELFDIYIANEYKKIERTKKRQQD